jgi:excinuclease UvrABC nuclease subunit
VECVARYATMPETRTTRWSYTDFGLNGTTRVGLYRMWANDVDLLYIGISRNVVERWRTHRRTAAWWHDVSTITLEVYRDRYAAECAEKAAIRADRPFFNIALVA